MPPASWLCLQRQAMKTLVYAIDRIEGRFAVLGPDEGPPIEVAQRDLPKGVREGSVLRVGMNAQGQPDWSTAVIDRKEEEPALIERRNCSMK